MNSEGDVDKQNERLKKLGIETHPEKSIVCCYSVQDKVWVKDPDENAWETFLVLKDSEEIHDPGSPKVCCDPIDIYGSSCGIKI